MKHKKLMALALAAGLSASAFSATAFARDPDRFDRALQTNTPAGAGFHLRQDRRLSADDTTLPEKGALAEGRGDKAAKRTGKTGSPKTKAGQAAGEETEGSAGDAARTLPDRAKPTDAAAADSVTDAASSAAETEKTDDASDAAGAAVQAATGRTLTCWVTAYCGCTACSGGYGSMTATGVTARPNHTIAVDPSVIPYGTQVEINGIVYTAEDCGGAVKGNSIDIYFAEHWQAEQFATGYYTVTIL